MDVVKRPEMDEELDSYLRAVDAAAEDRALEQLVQQVEPAIRRIIRQKALLLASGTPKGFVSVEAEHGEDLYGDAVLRLLERLRALKQGGAGRADGGDRDGDGGEAASAAIQSFRGLADSITRNLINEHLRRKYPRRASLRNQLTYILQKVADPKTGKTRYALWVVERDRLCGLLEWMGRALAITQRYRTLKEEPRAFAREVLPHGDGLAVELPALLESLFRWLLTPLELDDLVGAVAHLRGVEDRPAGSLDQSPEGEEGPTRPEPVGDEPSPEEQTLMRAYLRQVWEGMGQLPPAQCAALLLNLTDHRGRGVIDLLPILRIATLRQIAAVMGLPAEQLAELWSRLPLEDQQIAQILACPTGRIAVWRWRARQKLETLVRSA